ncbi:hypothetical protein KCU88_g1101, partial [Aureobasidium melanogenum]
MASISSVYAVYLNTSVELLVEGDVAAAYAMDPISPSTRQPCLNSALPKSSSRMANSSTADADGQGSFYKLLNRECVTSTKACEITWLHSDLSGRSLRDENTPHEHTQQLPGAKGRPLLTERERARHIATIVSSTNNATVEELLTDLDTRLRDLEGDHIAYHGPFGVFRLRGGTPNEIDEFEAVENVEPRDQIDSAIDQIFEPPATNGAFEASDTPTVLDESHLLPLLPDEQLLDSSQDGINWDDFHMDLATETSFSDTIAMANGLSCSIPTAMSLTYSFDVHDLDFPTIRLLLDRYQNTLVPYFAPARIHVKSPWEALHIPKVHETLGEVILRGDAGNSKVCLLFAVLGASAFHLDILRTSSDEVTPPWRVIADSYRARAKARLKTSLQSLSPGKKQEDYKDVLLALLSMVTVCVVSGDMDEAYAYLHDVERLIALYGLDKIRKSAGVQMLHSTYLYLRTLQASVSSFSGQRQERSNNKHLEPGNALAPTKQPNSLWTTLLQADSKETALTGIRMFEVAGEAVKQVWEARDVRNDRNLTWSQILMENKTLDSLILS